jgi:DNA-binding NarL/FixJ family response regulator
VRVVLAEDSGLLRDALTRLLGDHEIEVAAAVTTVPELLEAYEREQPDVAVIDVRLPPTFTD